ncbi:MAG: GNAT family N-acetyltransferase [Bacteroidia bacterium]
MPTLKIITQSDIRTIYNLAREIWYDHYLSIITAEQIEYMLDKFYSPAALEKSMDEGQMIYLIKDENQNSIGYLAVTENPSGHWFMNKFYIQTQIQGKGIGAKILKQWENIAKPKELRLQVNRKNFKSINFYFKCGFTIKEVTDFDIGNGYSMDDFVMVKGY